MAEKRSVVMPNAEELMRRLTIVNNDPHFVNNLYPIVVQRLAGETTYGSGVTVALGLSIVDYAKGMPEVSMEVKTMMPMFIEGILIGDQSSIKADALDLYQRAYGLQLANSPAASHGWDAAGEFFPFNSFPPTSRLVR